MQQNFPDPILIDTLVYERGYSNNPHDPGGSTDYGITQKTYDSYRIVHRLTRASVKLIQISERDQIYREQYWNHIQGDVLRSGIDMSVFDCAVNSGPVEAIILLQKALSIKADGHLGVQTLARLRGVNDIEALIQQYNSYRLGFMHRLRNFKFFDKGWTARVHQVNEKSMQLAKV